MPKAGLEPALREEKHFECSASAISPLRPVATHKSYLKLAKFQNWQPSNKVERMVDAKKRTVIVAEDESLIRMDIVETLRENGFDVIAEAADGEQTVALVKEHHPDLLVMDIKMPNMDGITAAEALSGEKVPIVLLTAFSQKELVDRASEAGAMAYVVKPFSPSDLLPAIEIALSHHSQLVALENEITDLNERFETRKLVDRAKGLLNEKMGLSEPDAFRWIQKASMDRRLTMQEVAVTIIEQLSAAKPGSPAAD